MGSKKTNTKTTPFLPPFPCSASPQTPLPNPQAVQKGWAMGGCSSASPLLPPHTFLCSSVGSSTGGSSFRNIHLLWCVPLCRLQGISALPWGTSSSFLWPWWSLSCFSLFLFPVVFLPFFKISFPRGATHALGLMGSAVACRESPRWLSVVLSSSGIVWVVW